MTMTPEEFADSFLAPFISPTGGWLVSPKKVQDALIKALATHRARVPEEDSGKMTAEEFWPTWFPQYCERNPDYWKDWKRVARDCAEAYHQYRVSQELEK